MPCHDNRHLDIHVYTIHIQHDTHTHTHTKYDGYIIYIICKHTQTQTQTCTHTDAHRQTDRQTDRWTDRRTHTHIEPSPWAISLRSIEVSHYRAVCERHQILHEGESKRRQEIRQYATTAYPLVATNVQSNIYAWLYLPTHSIPKIKAQLPISYNGRHTDIILSVCMHGHYTPPVRTTKAHTHMSLSTSPYSPLVLHGL